MSNIGSNNPNVSSIGIGKLGVGIYGVIESIIPIGALVYYAFDLISDSEAIIEQVGRASSLTTTRASNSTATYQDGHTETYGTNTAALSDKGALIQGAATNEVPNSDLTNWPLQNLTRDIADLTEDGYVFTKLTEAVTTSIHRAYQTLGTAIPIGDASVSAVIKQGSRQWATLTLWKSTTDNLTAVIDLSTKTLASTNQSGSYHSGITFRAERLTNDIYRYTLSCTKATADITLALVGMSDSASPSYVTGTPSYLGDGSDCYFCNLQAEASLYPSSFITTTGTAATRAADNSTVANTNWPVNDFKLEMTFIWNGTTASLPRYFYSIVDTSNIIQFYSNSGTTSFTLRNRVGGVNYDTALTATAFAVGDEIKLTVTKDGTLGTTLRINNITTATDESNTEAADTEDTASLSELNLANIDTLASPTDMILKNLTVTPL